MVDDELKWPWPKNNRAQNCLEMIGLKMAELKMAELEMAQQEIA